LLIVTRSQNGICQPIALPLERYAADTLVNETRRADYRLRLMRPGIGYEIPDDARLSRTVPM
jgi:hypothetical protein